MTGSRGESRKDRRNARSGRRRRVRWGRVLFLAVLLVLLAGGGAAAALVVEAVRTLPSIDQLRPQPALTSIIYDIHGNPAVDIPAIENRLPVDIDKVPKHVQDAVVAIEDARFWQHHGIDLIGIARAVVRDLTGGHLQGGSTITQQLARNAFPIGTQRTLKRKIQEAILAIELERNLTKKEILQGYLTWVPFGNHAYGIEAAARTYFDKPASELTLEEGALLAGLPNAPSALNPFVHPQAALERRNLVLDRMADLGFITRAQAEEAKKKPLGVKRGEVAGPNDYKYPYFVDYVIDQLEAKGFTDQQIFSGGLHVYTTLDPQVQESIEKAVADNFAALAKTDKKFSPDAQPEIETAAVIIDQHNGYILGMVGGRKHEHARDLNRVWQAQHQPGSAIKPLAVYTPAFALGYSPATVVDDRPYLIKTPGSPAWVPQNYDNAYQGLTTIREAVRRSVNAVAAATLQMIGVDNGFEYAQKLGLVHLDPKRDRIPSLALGGVTYGLTPLEVANAYATLANGGVRTQPMAILKVTDSQGHVLTDGSGKPAEYSPKFTPVVSPQVAYLMTDVLRSVVDPYPSASGWILPFGTAPRAHIDGWPVAGKTGTTSEEKSVWFAGYTPKYTGVVWIGYDHERKLGNAASGGRWAAPLWHDMMAGALKGQKPTDFPRPDGIVQREIDIKSGKLAGPDTPPQYRRVEVFIAGTEPTDVSDVWVARQVAAGHEDLLWSAGCPYPPVTKTFLNREPFGFAQVEPIARAYYGSRYTDQRAINWIPKDMWLAPPTQTCGSGQPAQPPSSETSAGTHEPITVNVTVSTHHIDPVAIEAHVGQQVTLVIRNADKDVQHELKVDGWDFDVKIPPGETVTVTVVPHKAEAPTMRCVEEGHVDELARWFITE
ncbi:MAG: PBP1A family penicillin-binding protein [Clostridia bacterium]|nr:PBP1A family penicillin-binding protein [Clostridia bacterium]